MLYHRVYEGSQDKQRTRAIFKLKFAFDSKPDEFSPLSIAYDGSGAADVLPNAEAHDQFQPD